jgi:hypothetical protein
LTAPAGGGLGQRFVLAAQLALEFLDAPPVVLGEQFVADGSEGQIVSDPVHGLLAQDQDVAVLDVEHPVANAVASFPVGQILHGDVSS